MFRILLSTIATTTVVVPVCVVPAAATDQVPAQVLVDAVAAARTRDFVATGTISTQRKSRSYVHHDAEFSADRVFLPVAFTGKHLVRSAGVWVWTSGPTVMPTVSVAAAGAEGVVSGPSTSSVAYQQALGASAPLLAFDAVARTGGYVTRQMSGDRTVYTYRAYQGGSVYVLTARLEAGWLTSLHLKMGLRGHVSVYTARIVYTPQQLFVPVVSTDDGLAARSWCAHMAGAARTAKRAVLLNAGRYLQACSQVRVRRGRALFTSPVTGSLVVVP